jgi:DNA polymerase III sliding clamp (beta) subunit (PCNA family)
MITIQQDALNSALSAVTRASTKSALMAAFSLVRLDVNMNGILRLSCFNGETAARAVTNVACDEDLSVCVDAATLKAVVETLAGEIIIILIWRSEPVRLALFVQTPLRWMSGKV